VLLYRMFDTLTGILIYSMVIFGPWAFGTTQSWSIWTMNIGGYALGALWLLKRGTDWIQGFNPHAARPVPSDAIKPWTGRNHIGIGSMPVLGVLTVALLLYCLISAINARATFRPQTATFDYYDCLRWLPHSFDSRSTWFAFWTYFGLACSFWSIRDWLLGESVHVAPADYEAGTENGRGFQRQLERCKFPARLRQLLMVLVFNGGLLAAESIVQRLANSPKLLFVVQPEIHQTAITQLGPYAYRANGAEYLNLLWPVCLGFWWAIRGRASPAKSRAMLIGVGLTVVAVMMSASRGAVFVCTGLLFISALYLLIRVPFPSPHVKSAKFVGRYSAAVFIIPLVAAAFGWHELKPRKTGISESMERRERIYETARRMVKDFGVFGSGPGTYESVSELYRPEDPGFWPAQVHNDWLETRITFGLLGTALIVTVLAVIGLKWLQAGGPHEFVFLSGLALAGCLAHARFDFPFQVHSILGLFVLICAIVSTVSSWSRGCSHSGPMPATGERRCRVQ